MIGGITGTGSGSAVYAASFYQARLSQNLQNAQVLRQSRQGPVLTAQKAASPETPVQPVQAARPVSREEVSIPELTRRMENDPAEMAVRMRMQNAAEPGRLSPSQSARLNTLEGQLAKAENALAKNDLENAESILGAQDEKQESLIPELLPGKADETAALPGQAVLPGQEKDSAQGVEGAQKALEEGECKTCEERKYQDGSDDMGVSYQTPTNIKPEQAASAVRGHEMEHVYREQAKAGREGRKVVSQSVTMHTEICPECGKSFVSGGTTRTVTKADTDNNAQQQKNQEDQKTRTPFSAVA